MRYAKYLLLILSLGLVLSPNAFSYPYTVTAFSTSASGMYLGGTAEVNAYNLEFNPDLNAAQNDKLENVQFVVNNHNAQYGTSYVLPTSVIPPEIVDWSGITSDADQIKSDGGIVGGIIDLSEGTEFVSLKWGNGQNKNGGFGLFYVAGLDEFSFDLSSNSGALSHYREWGVSPVPEPASLMLLGAGLVGLAGFRREIRVTS